MTTAPVRPPFDPGPAAVLPGVRGSDSPAPDAPLAQQARAARVDRLRRIARF